MHFFKLFHFRPLIVDNTVTISKLFSDIFLQEKFKNEFKERVFCNSLRRICCPNTSNQEEEELALGTIPMRPTNGIETGPIDPHLPSHVQNRDVTIM